jgi:hypothetical protein
MIDMQLAPFGVRDTARPFFGCFDYKVKIDNPCRKYYPSQDWDGDNTSMKAWLTAVKRSLMRYTNANSAFLAPIADFIHILNAEDRVHHQGNHKAHIFYFTLESDFTSFVETFEDHIAEVVRPAVDYDPTALETPHDIQRSFRSTLFFDAFDYKITFDRNVDGDEIDLWVDYFFCGDASRFHYDATNKQRSLYLNSEQDVAITKLSHAPHIANIEQII